MAEDWRLPRIGTTSDPLRLGILISGSGSGMEALLRHQEQAECQHTTNVVISDRLGVSGLSKAQNMDVTAVVVPLPEIDDDVQRRLIHEEEINQVLDDHGVEVVILSGYMRLLTPTFVKPWMGRLLNIHPSLLPKYPGSHAHRDVIAAKETRSGCTVHFVDSGMDSGPILAQEIVEVLPGDNIESLAEKVKSKEHLLYPSVIDRLAAGEIEYP
jgi:formyltetrahydrofolate-dependent phosphoribosylglycinamide formyltransferase